MENPRPTHRTSTTHTATQLVARFLGGFYGFSRRFPTGMDRLCPLVWLLPLGSLPQTNNGISGQKSVEKNQRLQRPPHVLPGKQAYTLPYRY